MARARLLKPGFFTNAQLAQIPPYGRLLFAGLWTLADKAGRLKDEPLAIKGAVFPFEDVPVDALLRELHKRSFIIRYRAGSRYIQITNFSKHQSPHIREVESTIPAPGEHGASTVLNPEKAASDPSVPDPEYGIRNTVDHHPHQRVRARPLIFELYENAIGTINPTAAQLLKEAEGEYPAPCIEDAFKQAVALNKRSWAYVEAICKRHKAKGNCDDDRPKQPVQAPSRTPSRRSERGAPPDIAEWERYARGDES